MLLCPWDFPGKSTGVDCHFLLQGIFPTQGSNLGVPHCRKTLPSQPPGKCPINGVWTKLVILGLPEGVCGIYFSVKNSWRAKNILLSLFLNLQWCPHLTLLLKLHDCKTTCACSLGDGQKGLWDKTCKHQTCIRCVKWMCLMNKFQQGWMNVFTASVTWSSSFFPFSYWFTMLIDFLIKKCQGIAELVLGWLSYATCQICFEDVVHTLLPWAPSAGSFATPPGSGHPHLQGVLESCPWATGTSWIHFADAQKAECLWFYTPWSSPQTSQVVLVVKSPPASVGDIRDLGSVPGSGRSPGGGQGNLLQYSCLENPIDRGTCWATVHRVAKSRTWLKWLNTHMQHGTVHGQSLRRTKTQLLLAWR